LAEVSCKHQPVLVHHCSQLLAGHEITCRQLGAAAAAAVAAVAHLQEMKIENIDSTLEEIQEVGEQMRVINEAISQPVGGFADMEMDDLEAELAELEAEELDNQLLEPAPGALLLLLCNMLCYLSNMSIYFVLCVPG
jgi:glycine cleavage system regulatory protein